ncbi:MAG: histidine kinase dimerization/phospho-acceptor domain-containing protein, partial [Oscillospiraceae bacterium]
MRRTWVKCVCAALCVLLLVVGGLGSIFAVSWYVDTNGVTFYESSLCWRVTNSNLELVEAGIDILADQSGENLSAYAQQQLQEITQSLDPAKSNFRYRCTAPDGTVVLANVEGEDWRESVYRVSAPRVYETYVYDETGGGWEDYTVECGVAAPLRADDAYAKAKDQFDWLTDSKAAVISACVGCIAAGVILLILLLAAAGRRVGREEVVLNVQDRIPYDLYLAMAVFLGLLLCALWLEGTYYYERSEPELGIVWVAAASLGLAILALAMLLTTATRIKAHVLLHNTLIARICRAIKRGVTRVYRSLPMTGRAVLLFLAYLLGTVLTSATIVLVPIYQGFVLYLICRWVIQWRQIRAGTQDIVSGKPDVKIETAKFYPDLKEHAEQLNDLGGAIDNAVDERMKSERFKTELITNVSHDLKTPLTSIINYVDLLKK